MRSSMHRPATTMSSIPPGRVRSDVPSGAVLWLGGMLRCRPIEDFTTGTAEYPELHVKCEEEVGDE